MKTLFKSGLAILSCLIILTACNKENDVQVNETEKEITAQQMQNKNNSEDQVGMLHNRFLDYFAANTKIDSEVNFDLFLNVYTKFAAENKIDFNDVQRRTLSSSYSSLREMVGANNNISNISLDMCKRFPALCNITGTGPYNPNNLLDKANGGTSYQRTLKYIDAIKSIEAKVIASKEIAEDDKRAILAYYTVARHSASYWHNVENVYQGKSYWYNTSNAEASAARPCQQCNVVNADITGAVVGSVGGPVGSLGGAVVFSTAAALWGWKWF